MALQLEDIKFYKSSTSGSLGGAPNFDEEVSVAPNEFWDSISGEESSTGDIEYRCMYIRNTSTTNSLLSPSVNISIGSTDPDTTIHIAVMDDVNVDTVSIANEGVSPVGDPQWKPVGVDIPLNEPLTFDVSGAGDYNAIWIRRTVLNINKQAAEDDYTISVHGQTLI